MGAFGSNRPKRAAEEYQAQSRLLAAQGIEQVESAQARNRSQEDARLSVLGLLGTPGSYDLPGTGGVSTPGTGTTPGNIYAAPGGPGSLALSHLNTGIGYEGSTVEESNKRYLGENYQSKLGTRDDILDPDAFAGEVGKTSAFRQRSRLTAEAEQLLAREGEEWNRINSSTLGLITEGAANARAEESREIKRMAAKGGTARRNAFMMAQNAQVREQSNTLRIQQTWKANLELDKYIKANANLVEEGNTRFLNNLPQLRSSYTETMNSLTELMTKVALPIAADTQGNAYQARASAKKEGGWLGKLLIGGAAIIGGALTGGAAIGGIAGVLGGGLSAGASVLSGGQIGSAGGFTPSNIAGGLSKIGNLFGGGGGVTAPQGSGVFSNNSAPAYTKYFDQPAQDGVTAQRAPAYTKFL